jgi:hypothetical protein
MDNLSKAVATLLFDYSVALSIEKTKDGRKWWVIRSTLGDEWYWCWEVATYYTFEELLETWLLPAAKDLAEKRKADPERYEDHDGFEDLPEL